MPVIMTSSAAVRGSPLRPRSFFGARLAFLKLPSGITGILAFQMEGSSLQRQFYIFKSASSYEFISQPLHGDEHNRLFGIRFKFLSQTADVNVYGSSECVR